MSSGTVLVTGSSGFIGSHVAADLASAGYEIIGFDINPPPPGAAFVQAEAGDAVQFVQGSIDNWAQVVSAISTYRPTTIVHIAASADVPGLNLDPLRALRLNGEAAVHLLEAARIFDVERVVLFSSIGVLPAVRYEPIDGNHPVITSSDGPAAGFYGAAKVTAEAFAWAYQDVFGLDSVVIRPSAIYGFNMTVPNYVKPMVENSVRGEPTVFEKGGDYPRDYTHVRDVARLTRLVLEADKKNMPDRVYYAATGQDLVTAGRVAEVVKELIPGADIEIGAGMTDDDRKTLRMRGVISIDNAREQLGYEPEFVDIKKGVAEYIETHRAFISQE